MRAKLSPVTTWHMQSMMVDLRNEISDLGYAMRKHNVYGLGEHEVQPSTREGCCGHAPANVGDAIVTPPCLAPKLQIEVHLKSYDMGHREDHDNVDSGVRRSRRHLGTGGIPHHDGGQWNLQ